MKLSRNFIKEQLKAFKETISILAKADSGEEDGQPQTPAINYEDLIQKARQEEKAKQYKAIEKLKGQVDVLTQQHNNDLLTIGTLQEELKNAKDDLTKSSKDDSEEVKTLKEKLKTLEKENSTLQDKINSTPIINKEELEAEIRKTVEAEYETKLYRIQKLAEAGDEILVPELVIGSTKEEIDKSLENALARSKEISEKLGAKTSKRTPKNSTNPQVDPNNFGSSIEQIAHLEVGSPEYAEFRKRAGLK